MKLQECNVELGFCDLLDLIPGRSEEGVKDPVFVCDAMKEYKSLNQYWLSKPKGCTI